LQRSCAFALEAVASFVFAAGEVRLCHWVRPSYRAALNRSSILKSRFYPLQRAGPDCQPT